MKRFITVRLWEETKEKLEYLRIIKSSKQKRIISLAQLIDEMVDESIKKEKTNIKDL